MRGESGAAGKGRVVIVPKFHSWGKCAMPLTNNNSDWMCNASSGLCINLHYINNYSGPLFHILGCNKLTSMNGLMKHYTHIVQGSFPTGKAVQFLTSCLLAKMLTFTCLLIS